jgi:Glyoxalase-like domain
MSISVLGISVDAVDAARLANFWAQASSRTVDDGATEDLASIAVDAEAERLTRLGAKQIRSLSANNNRWISFLDPEGNEFDLVAG